jgi:hypothetical protein
MTAAVTACTVTGGTGIIFLLAWTGTGNASYRAAGRILVYATIAEGMILWACHVWKLHAGNKRRR